VQFGASVISCVRSIFLRFQPVLSLLILIFLVLNCCVDFVVKFLLEIFQKFIEIVSHHFVFLVCQFYFAEHFDCCLGLILKANFFVVSIGIELVLDLILPSLPIFFNFFIVFVFFLLLVLIDFSKC